MMVNLKRDFFGPNGSLYTVANNPHTFPEEWKLPSDAKLVKEEEDLPKPVTKK